MNPEPIKVKSELNVRATAEAQAKVQEDLTIEDPTDENAKVIIEKAIVKGLDNEESEQGTSQECRASDSTNSKPEKE